MPQRPLIVHVEEPETGASWDYTFEAGPVIVGRGDNVTLQLARGFVSLHHGTFDFDDQNVTYVDLDSRNGTLIDGTARGTDRPVPVTETTDIRIGKLRLKLARVAVPKKVGEEGVNPFAPRAGAKVAQKGTDALPREDVDRIRREMLERKQVPAPAPAPLPAPRVEPPPIFAPPMPPRYVAPAQPKEPTLEKTVPVPALQSQPAGTPIPRETRPRSATPYEAGGTTAVPTLPREAPVRRTSRPKIPVVTPTPRRAAPRRAVKGRTWLPFVVLGLAMVTALVVVLLVTAEDGDKRHPRERADAGSSARGGVAEMLDAETPPAEPDAEAAWGPPDPPAPREDAASGRGVRPSRPPRPPRVPEKKSTAPIIP